MTCAVHVNTNLSSELILNINMTSDLIRHKKSVVFSERLRNRMRKQQERHLVVVFRRSSARSKHFGRVAVFLDLGGDVRGEVAQPLWVRQTSF